ncbi:MAG: hypothetical protein AMJ43_08485 [Coxiella sp. DG_40]|nr:MAG: hypothetical protein AMJ43_08485 [Coxiella sp. DG_40]
MSEVFKKNPFQWKKWLPLAAVLLLVAPAIWLLRSSPVTPEEIHHILLISIDTCRADYLSCYGYPRKTTPNIDAVAKEGILFSNALTPIPLTLPAHASMLTGTNPPYHGVHNNVGYKLSESNRIIAEILRWDGYSTGAIISAFVIDAQFGLNQGFDYYNDEFVDPIESFFFNERRGGEASQFACDWFEKHQNEPSFLFLHYFDPHEKYDPPEPFATLFKNNLYAGEIAYTDYCIGDVIKKLKDLNLYDSTLIIITGDHGELLGEHGELTHGYFIYHSALHVPLIIKVPKGPKGEKIDDVVALVDIVPTICGLLKISPPPTIHGIDLSPLIYKKGKINKDQRYIFSESLTPTEYDCTPLLGVVNGHWKYIQAPRPELYDLDKDRKENNNLVDKDPKRAQLLQNHLKLILQEQLRSEQMDTKVALDEQTRERLESLGYIGTGALNEDFNFDSTKNEPKDSIQLHQQTMMVRVLIVIKRFTEAENICRTMLEKLPDYILTYYFLGEIAMARNNAAEAIEYYSKFLSQIDSAGHRDFEGNLPVFLNNPVYRACHNTGATFAQLENFEKAIEFYNKALQLDPAAPKTYNKLGTAFFSLGKITEALKHYTKALDLDPNSPEAHFNLAYILHEQDKIDEAITHYEKALELKPDWPDARKNLLLAQMRKKEKEQTSTPPIFKLP